MPDKKKGSSNQNPGPECPDFDGFREGLWNACLVEEGDPPGYATMCKKAFRDLTGSVKDLPPHIKLGVLLVGFLGYVVLQALSQKDPVTAPLALGLFGGFGFLTLKGAAHHVQENRNQEESDTPQL